MSVKDGCVLAKWKWNGKESTKDPTDNKQLRRRSDNENLEVHRSGGITKILRFIQVVGCIEPSFMRIHIQIGIIAISIRGHNDVPN